MAWSKYNWVENVTKAVAARFNNEESGIEEALTESIVESRLPPSVVSSSTGGIDSGPQPGRRRLSLIKGGINGWIEDNGGMPLDAFGVPGEWRSGKDCSSLLQEAVNASVELEGVPILLPWGEGEVNAMVKMPTYQGFRIPILGVKGGGTVVKLPEVLQLIGSVAPLAGRTLGGYELRDLIIDGNNQVATSESVAVIGMANTVGPVNIEDVWIERVSTRNLPNQYETGRRNISFVVWHKEAGQTQNWIDRIVIKDCPELVGGQGVFINGANGESGHLGPANVQIRRVLVENMGWSSPTTPTEGTNNNAGLQIGQAAYSDGSGVFVINCTSEGSWDVGMEFDVPCTVYRPVIKNANNDAFLMTPYQGALMNEPVVTKITTTAAAGATVLKVTSTAGFTAGQQLILFGGSQSTCEVRTIKKVSAGELELETATGLEHKTGIPVQQAEDPSQSKWSVRDLKVTRTEDSVGLNRGLVIQNQEGVLPMAEVDIDGYEYTNTFAGVVNEEGEILYAACGNANSPTGNPAALKVKRIRADVQALNYAGGGAVAYNPFEMKMYGPSCLVELEGELTIKGVGQSGAGALSVNMRTYQHTQAILDEKMRWKLALTKAAGTIRAGWYNLGTVGSLQGIIRDRVHGKVQVAEGAPTIVGAALGRGSSYASQSIITTMTEAKPAETLTLPVASTEGFGVGMAIVVNAQTNPSCEIFVIASLVTNTSITLAKAGATPGLVVERPAGTLIAALHTLTFEDCNWLDMASPGVKATAFTEEDANVLIRVLKRNNIYPSIPGSVGPSVPGTEKPFMLTQSGLLISNGTVTEVKRSFDGVNYEKVAGANAGNIVNAGDFMEFVGSSLSATLYPDRNG